MAKLLVVDDSKLTRRLVTEALEEAGHRCVQADNGVTGLEAFHAGSFDAVLTDLLMPEMDGFEFASAIREAANATPILVLSADIQESSRRRCEELGVSRMLTKPTRPADLLEQLEGLLQEAAQPVGG